jgi:hypothetical protein
MDQWTPEQVEDGVQFMADFAVRLEGTREFVDHQALSPEGTLVRYDGEGRPPVTDGPFAETQDLIAGWLVIDVDTYDRALALAGEYSAAPEPVVSRSTSGSGAPVPGRIADGHRVTGPSRQPRPPRRTRYRSSDIPVVGRYS